MPFRFVYGIVGIPTDYYTWIPDSFLDRTWRLVGLVAVAIEVDRGIVRRVSRLFDGDSFYFAFPFIYILMSIKLSR